MAIEIKKNIYWIGVNDRTTDLFEGLWPISKEGVTYNSYLINDKKKAIIDLSKSIKTDSFFDEVASVIDIDKIDYVIINHMEPDHTGVLKTLRRLSPSVKILCTAKAKKMLADYYSLTDNIVTVEDGEVLDLGENKLVFHHIPFVHWPETMATYNPQEGILFSCDAFGSYGAFSGNIFDDNCKNIDFYKNEALRYYVNIVAKFSRNVINAIEKLKNVDIKIIAPSHGLVWREKPGDIIELYRQWAELAGKPGEPGITLIYGSMYGNTEKMMNTVALGASSAGLPVEIFDAARTDTSYIMPSVWKRSGVIIGAPTYEVGLFPPMINALELLALKKIENKKALYFGSYGWSGGALKKVLSITEPLKWEFKDTFEFQGGATEADLEKGYEMGKKFAEQLKVL